MREVNSILNKVLVKQFYLLNAGFFLVVITLAFGFMSGAEHKALAQFFISSPIILSIPFIIWVLYLIKIIHFNRQRLWFDENQFIFHVNLFPTVPRILAIASCITAQFMPALAYAMFLLLMAIDSDLPVTVLSIIGGQLLLLGIGIFTVNRFFSRPEKEITVSALKHYFDRTISKPISFFYVGWIFHREPALLLGTKIFCAAILFAVTQLYLSEPYDWRLLAMGVVVATSGNYRLISEFHRFDHFHFRLFKNLPVSSAKRILTLVIVLSIFFLPEFILLSRKFPLNLSWVEFPLMAVLMLSSAVFYYAINFLSIPQENFSRWILGSVILGILAVLFGVPLIALSSVYLLTGFVIYRKKYFDFEYPVEFEDH